MESESTVEFLPIQRNHIGKPAEARLPSVRPILVLAGNKRLRNTLALVTENWFVPELDPSNSPLSLPVRFFGRKIAVAVGGVFTIKSLEKGLPVPILNFTYHFG